MIQIHRAQLLDYEKQACSGKQDNCENADIKNEEEGQRVKTVAKRLKLTAAKSLFIFCPFAVSPSVSGCTYQSFKLFSADSRSLTQ